MAEEKESAPFGHNVHLLGIQEALSTSGSSEKIQIWQQLEATLNRFKPEVESAMKTSAMTSNGPVSPCVSPLHSPSSPPNEPPPNPSNAEEPEQCNHEIVKKSHKHCTNCGKLRRKYSHAREGDEIDLDSDSNNSTLQDSAVLCYSGSSEEENNQDLLNIEYVSASQDESPDLLTSTGVNTNNTQMRDFKIAIMKANLVAMKNTVSELGLNPLTSASSSPESPKDEKVHVEFEIGAEISVPNTSSLPTPTNCYSSPLSKHAPAKRSPSESKRKGECTCCHETTIYSAMEFTSHPWLGVLICQKCFEFIHSGEYSIEEGKEIFCRWCGDGGEIVNCCCCEKSFCKFCLNSNLGEGTWDKVTGDDNWNCFVCDDSPIKHLVEECIQLLLEKEDLDMGKNSKRRGDKRGRKTRGNVKVSKGGKRGKEKQMSPASTPSSLCQEKESGNSDQYVSGTEEASDVDSDSLSLSDLDLLDPPEPARKRTHSFVQSESDDLVAVQSDNKDEDSLPPAPPKPKRVTKTQSKKAKLDPFGSSGDEAIREVTMLPVDNDNYEASATDSDMFEEQTRRLDKYEYQLGSDEEQSTSERSDSELQVKKKKKKREFKRARKSKSDGDDDELSLCKSLETRPRGKRKAKLISESSASSSQSDTQGETGKGKKRGRKKIRKLISDFKLSQSTREAEKAETQRLERLQHKETVLIDDNDDDSCEDTLVEPLVLEKGKEGSGPMSVSRKLVKQLKPHQREGISFLWDSVCESVSMLRDSQGSGSLLAHCMGLGKTIQVITLIDTLLRNSGRTGVSKILIITPVNVLYNWKAEFDKWVEDRDYTLHILESKDLLKTRIRTMEFWDEDGGILLSGYDMFRNFCVGKKIKSKKKKDKIFEILVDPGAQFVICDEGHVMRNSKSGLSKCLNLIGTRRRIVLTGTPLQNNLQEYYCMTNFIKPNLLGSQTEFTNRFANPITNGQHADSTMSDVRVMKQRAHILHEKLKGCVQRQDYRALTKYLPPKHEFVISARLTEIQINLYEAFLASIEKRELFPVYNVTRRIWSHPWILKKEQQLQRNIREKRMDEDEMSDFIVSNSEDEDSDCEHKPKKKKVELVPRRHKRNSRQTVVEKSREQGDTVNNLDDVISIGSSSSSREDDDYEPDDLIIEPKPKIENCCVTSDDNLSDMANEVDSEPKDWFDDFIPPEVETQIQHSAKLMFLFELLAEAKKLNEKVLVFSQSLQMLDLIEFYLQGPQHNWVKGMHYYRMDGSTPIDTRDSSSSIFNNPKNPRMRLYLISTKAGSLGINLIAANRVVIMDASWNPTHDTQSIFRVYRFGQVKPVFIYRLIAKGTMEEKIYDRQVTKESLALRVIDEQQIGRHFTSSDLAELFRFEPEDIRFKEVSDLEVKSELVDSLDSVEIISCVSAPPVNSHSETTDKKRPEADLVLCNILDKLQPKYLMNYHEHDSLTEHIFDEELSEEEKKAAWESYNTSKETISREYVQQMWQEKQAQQNQMAQFQIARQMLSQGQIPSQPSVQRLPVPPIHQMLASNQSVTNKLQHHVLKESVARYQAILANNPGLGNAEQGNLFATIHHQVTSELVHRNIPQALTTDSMRPQVPPGMQKLLPNVTMARQHLPAGIVNRAPSVPRLFPMPRGMPVPHPQSGLQYPPPVTTTVPQARPHPPITQPPGQNKGRVTKSAAVNEKSYPSFQEQTYPVESISLLSSDVISIPSNQTID